MEPRKRTHLVTELVNEATLMQSVLEKAMEAKQLEITQIKQSGHITDDEPNAPPVYTLQEEHAAWKQVLHSLQEIQTALDRIEHAERQRMAH
jgi:hypothetical protein